MSLPLNPFFFREIDQAAQCLRAGGVLAYPTETFWGVGCKACHAAAALRVYAAKRRVGRLPLPVLGADRAQLERLAVMDARAEALMERFWPGPLTLLLPARSRVPECVTAGTGRIAVRVSSHGAARALAAATGEALAASSANVSGRPAVTSLACLDPELLAAVDGVLDCGEAPAGGLPSTLLEIVESGLVRVLRAGAVDGAALEGAGYAVLPVGRERRE